MKHDKICYTIESSGKVVISRVNQAESDPILGQFLNFLVRDIEKNPQDLKAISPDLVSRIRSLVSDVDLDLNLPLLDEDE